MKGLIKDAIYDLIKDEFQIRLLSFSSSTDFF